MFGVQRFDPTAPQPKSAAPQKKSKKRKLCPSPAATKSDSLSNSDSLKSSESGSETGSDSPNPSSNVLFSLSPTSPPLLPQKAPTKITNEQLDDFDFSNDSDSDSSSSPPPLSPSLSAALHLTTLPIADSAALLNLHPHLISQLTTTNITALFPIQALVLPQIISTTHFAHLVSVRDICVSAPTGSGKTLAFVLPILNRLLSRNVMRLRALVVLPGRDLAKQVHGVFQDFSRGSKLKIGLAVGQKNLTDERSELVLGASTSRGLSEQGKILLNENFEGKNLKACLDAFPNSHSSSSDERGGDPNFTASGVDVLVCTPGRLMEHVNSTKGFTLQHLEFLVIDEADRLVSQGYQNWVEEVLKAATQSKQGTGAVKVKEKEKGTFHFNPTTTRKSEKVEAKKSIAKPVQLTKLLFSATLTRDPQKLAGLYLNHPQFFDARDIVQHTTGGSVKKKKNQTYAVPSTLKESRIVCSAEQKPLVLIALILEHLRSPSTVVVFTSSVDSTHRLTRLLQIVWRKIGKKVDGLKEFSSALNGKERATLIKMCNENVVDVVVCSDGMSRGMDISNVGLVVNYDVPGFAKTYVHRVGRTARAGKEGTAVTILKNGQIGKFNSMRGLCSGGHESVKEVEIDKGVEGLDAAVGVFGECVGMLPTLLKMEKDGKVGVGDLKGIDLVCDGGFINTSSSSAPSSDSSSDSSSDLSSESD